MFIKCTGMRNYVWDKFFGWICKLHACVFWKSYRYEILWYWMIMNQCEILLNLIEIWLTCMEVKNCLKCMSEHDWHL